MLRGISSSKVTKQEWWSQKLLRWPGLCPCPAAEPPALPWLLGEELENTEPLVPGGSGMTKAVPWGGTSALCGCE